MKLAAVLVTVLSWPLWAAANTDAAVARFIQDAPSDVNSAPASSGFATGWRSAGTWLEELQLRQKSNSTLNPYAEGAAPSYELRLTPKAWGQRAAEQDALNWRTDMQAAQVQAGLAGALRRRYQVALELLAQQANAQGLLQAIALQDSEVRLNKSQVTGRDFNLRRLLDAEVLLSRTQGQFDAALLRLNEWRKTVALPAHTRVSLLGDDAHSAAISPPQMRAVMARAIDTQQIPPVRALRLQWARLSAEEAVAQARQRPSIAAVSIERFSGERGAGGGGSSSDKRTQIAVSVNIPLGSDNFKTLDSRYATQAAALAYEQRLADETQALLMLRTDADGLLQAWELAQQGLQKNATRLANPATKNDAELALLLRQEDARQARELLSIEQKMRSVYVHYLDASGLLAQTPWRHWLRPHTPVMAQD
jgi:hypothetical protein